MCLIVDACVASRVLITIDDSDYQVIHEMVLKGELVVVYGGGLLREYQRINGVMQIIRILDQAGIARVVPDQKVNAEDSTLKKRGVCRSNDTHVLALALVSNARLLCSADKGLHSDFKNPKILPKPRGRIYQHPSHWKLLNRWCKVCRKIG